jgi:hypothetical protein
MPKPAAAFASLLSLMLTSLMLIHPAVASDVRFVGQSRASPQLRTDLIAVISGYSMHQYKCPTVSSIDSTVLPPAYKPRTAIYQIGAANHHYERWTATACDTKRTFLVGLWPVPQGGADYKVVEIPPGVEP